VADRIRLADIAGGCRLNRRIPAPSALLSRSS
jgi:hypothetical protein